MTKTKKDLNEDAEYGLDSRFKSNMECESEATALMEARNIIKTFGKYHINFRFDSKHVFLFLIR
jgi:hypothetical protein